ncbi:glycosyltransferase family 4 protein [Candidatus Saccharibacteria bacterium]|nr:glycosyltransferase family 4 protein [Candidatus Saccharibacteria bacterium]
MAHIAIDARIINSSTGTYVERLLHYLQQIDTTNSYTVLVRAKDKDYWSPNAANFKVKIAEFDNYSFSEQLGFKRFLDKLQPDLVHFCMPQQPLFYKGKKVTTIHDLTLLRTYNSDKNWLMFHLKQQVGRLVFWVIGRTNSHLITPSHFTKKDYVTFSGIADTKVSVTYEAADINKGAMQEYPHPYSRYLLYVGQQSDYKNIPALAHAHQKLLPKYPDLGLILVGNNNASAQKNQQLFTQKNYKNITFTGFIPNEQRDWLYTRASAYIFPTRMEGFGLPGLEAMGYGAPVVSSNATCLPEIYKDAAHYFNPDSVDDMARAIDEVLSSESLRRTLISNGKKVHASYSWRRMAEETHAIYIRSLKILE